jgi:hypothetical protein
MDLMISAPFKKLPRNRSGRDRRFPLPWSIVELEACFVVIDSAGQKLAYVYFEEEPGSFNTTAMSRRRSSVAV